MEKLGAQGDDFSDKHRDFIKKLAIHLGLSETANGERSAIEITSQVTSYPSSPETVSDRLEPSLSPQKSLDEPPNCPYRAVDIEKGIWYCDTKQIPKVVCIRRQQRFLHFNRRCYPYRELKQKRRFPSDRKKESSDHYCAWNNRWIPKDQLPTLDCLKCPNKEACIGELRL